MIEKIQNSLSSSFSGWLTLVWVIGISVWGGTVSYLYKIEKASLPFSLIKLLIELITAAFVGVITFLMCQASNISLPITAALVGISGHMGTRALFILEKKYEDFFTPFEDRRNGKD